MNRIVLCPYCFSEAERVTGREIYSDYDDSDKDYLDKYYYICRKCDAYVGCHPDTDEPLGRLANEELRQMRIKVHDVLDHLWKSGQMDRQQAYRRLADRMGIGIDKCHVGMFDLERCNKALKCLENIGG